VLVHTEVAPSAEGKGVGSRLVAGALDDIRARGLRVVPLAPSSAPTSDAIRSSRTSSSATRPSRT